MLNTHINLTCIKTPLQKQSLEAQWIILICKVTHQKEYFQDWSHNFAIIKSDHHSKLFYALLWGKFFLSFLLATIAKSVKNCSVPLSQLLFPSGFYCSFPSLLNCCKSFEKCIQIHCRQLHLTNQKKHLCHLWTLLYRSVCVCPNSSNEILGLWVFYDQ